MTSDSRVLPPIWCGAGRGVYFNSPPSTCGSTAQMQPTQSHSAGSILRTATRASSNPTDRVSSRQIQHISRLVTLQQENISRRYSEIRPKTPRRDALDSLISIKSNLIRKHSRLDVQSSDMTIYELLVPAADRSYGASETPSPCLPSRARQSRIPHVQPWLHQREAPALGTNLIKRVQSYISTW